MDIAYHSNAFCKVCGKTTEWYHYNGGAPECGNCRDRQDAEKEPKYKFDIHELARLINYKAAMMRGIYTDKV